MELRPGTRLKSAVCSTEVVVVKAPKEAIDLRCGGTTMLGPGEEPPAGASIVADEGGTQLGKRYVSEEAGLEVLCTKAGGGSLALGDQPLDLQGARPLPPSD